MKECGDVWMTSPTFPGLLALHAFALITVNPSKNTCRLCTVRYNVQSCATRLIRRTTQMTQSKERLLHCTDTVGRYLTTHARDISVSLQNSLYKRLWRILDSAVALIVVGENYGAVKRVKQRGMPTFRAT